MLYWTQVWKQMHELTGAHIEKRAVMEFISYFEEQMNMVILQSIKELKKRNGLNKIQGLRSQQRIDRECVMNAIKIINNNGHSYLSERAGGKTKKETKRDKHTKENTEVV